MGKTERKEELRSANDYPGRVFEGSRNDDADANASDSLSRLASALPFERVLACSSRDLHQIHQKQKARAFTEPPSGKPLTEPQALPISLPTVAAGGSGCRCPPAPMYRVAFAQSRRASTSAGHAFPYPTHEQPTPHQIFHLPVGASQQDIKARCTPPVLALHSVRAL